MKLKSATPLVFKTIYFVVALFISLLFSSLYFSSVDQNEPYFYLFYFIVIFAIVLIFIFFSLLSIAKSKRRYQLVGNTLIYKTKNVEYKLSLIYIEKIYFRNSCLYSYIKFDYIELNEIKSYDIVLDILERMKLQKKINTQMIRIGKNLKEKLIGFIKSFINIMIKYRKEIIFGIIGLILSAASFILYFNFQDNVILIIIIIAIDVIFGLIQSNICYIAKLKENRIINLFYSCLFVFLFIIITFLVLIILSVVGIYPPFTMNYLLSSVFLVPSFVIVLAIIALLLFIAGS